VQVLTGLAMNILLIGQSPAAKDDPEVQGLIAESLALAKQCSRELRTLSYRLHPPELEGLGLVFALRSWAEGFGTRAGIRVDVELDDPGRLAPEVETALFRIAQEALGNVQRHSGSPTANLRLIARDREIQLEVEDAGQGFPPGVLERDGSGLQRVGVGILGMRERARQLGGSLQIRCDGSQTTVRVVLPREVTQ
jgi:signal transduction histidine kinase